MLDFPVVAKRNGKDIGKYLFVEVRQRKHRFPFIVVGKKREDGTEDLIGEYRDQAVAERKMNGTVR